MTGTIISAAEERFARIMRRLATLAPGDTVIL